VRDTTMQHAGLMLRNMAFHPFPTLDGEKKAAIEWAPYKTRRPTQAEIRKWWPPGSRRNLALVLGPIPRLLVLNVNQKHRHDGLSTLRRQGWTLPPTPTIVTPHDGFAYCFKPPDRQRHPYPFKTHPTVRGHPGIELRGEGGYQLVPPSAVVATARDPAGSYRFAEPWTMTHLLTDLADVPDWLLDLWITCDRAPAPPHPTGGTRGTRGRRPPVVVSPLPPVVVSLDTTTGGSPVPSGGIGASGLAALLRDRATMEACAACVGWRADGSNFACPLPGHAEANPSASLYWNDNGELVFRDWHRRSGKEFWTLSEVYAARVSGRLVTDADGLARTLAAASMATWSLRLLIVAKRLEPYPVALPPLLDGAPASVARLYDGLQLLFGGKWAYEPGQPTMFTRSFAMDWCGIGEKTAWVGTRWLLQRQIIVPAGKHQGRPLYLPGEPP
jgi:Bifunctional DNA primase/polymerase, N-terminal